ncbi:hypothetical protein, partial [Leucothrix mucor]|uniref:hypothetical protein n=1 Tax=Leucothrix mucor TaxID=45248 RepID=UPI00058D3701
EPPVVPGTVKPVVPDTVTPEPPVVPGTVKPVVPDTVTPEPPVVSGAVTPLEVEIRSLIQNNEVSTQQKFELIAKVNEVIIDGTWQVTDGENMLNPVAGSNSIFEAKSGDLVITFVSDGPEVKSVTRQLRIGSTTPQFIK